MNCEARQDLILLYVASELDADASRELCAHLATGCRTCNGHLAEAEALFFTLPLALEPRPVPHRAKQQLLAGLNKPGRRKVQLAPRKSRHDVLRVMTRQAAIYLAVACALFATVAFGGIYVALQMEIRGLNAEIRNLKMKIARRDERIQEFDQSIAKRPGLDIDVFVLERRDTQPPSARGHVLWDARHQQGRLHVSGLRPTGAGETYQLWLVANDQRRQPGATFGVGEDGTEQREIALETTRDVFIAAEITLEPQGGSAQPTGDPQLYGESDARSR